MLLLISSVFHTLSLSLITIPSSLLFVTSSCLHFFPFLTYKRALIDLSITPFLSPLSTRGGRYETSSVPLSLSLLSLYPSLYTLSFRSTFNLFIENYSSLSYFNDPFLLLPLLLPLHSSSHCSYDSSSSSSSLNFSSFHLYYLHYFHYSVTGRSPSLSSPSPPPLLPPLPLPSLSLLSLQTEQRARHIWKHADAVCFDVDSTVCEVRESPPSLPSYPFPWERSNRWIGWISWSGRRSGDCNEKSDEWSESIQVRDHSLSHSTSLFIQRRIGFSTWNNATE